MALPLFLYSTLEKKKLYGFVHTSIFKFENSKIININKSIKKMVIMKKNGENDSWKNIKK